MAEVSFLEALLGSTNVGRAVSGYRQRERQRGALEGLYQDEIQRAGMPQDGQVGPPVLDDAQRRRLVLSQLGAATNNPEFSAAAYGYGTDMPSAIREYQYYSNLPDDKKQEYLGVKRAQQVLDLGWGYGVLPPQGGVQPVAQKGLAPSDLPETRAAQQRAVLEEQLEIAPQIKQAEAAAQEVGKREGEAQGSLQYNLAALPRLEEVVKQLSELGQTATYTKAGQARDAVLRETGGLFGLVDESTEGGIARKEYVSKVDNEILPLLRETFGAQFTEKEGESLKRTLGDPNATPAEKDAVLRSFIQNKVAQIEVLRRQTGQSGEGSGEARPVNPGSSSRRRRFNPQTGQIE